MLYGLREFELASVGLLGDAGQHYKHRIHHELAAIQNPFQQQARLDEAIRREHQERFDAQYSVREARGRAEGAVDSTDDDRQRAHP